MVWVEKEGEGGNGLFLFYHCLLGHVQEGVGNAFGRLQREEWVRRIGGRWGFVEGIENGQEWGKCKLHRYK